jgi:chemotaxis regulatin CheY-phosphate phosphatase CheZ
MANKNIDELTIADLKAALDCIREHIADTKEKARVENCYIENEKFYQDFKDLEGQLYNKLLNAVFDLQLHKPVND